MLKLRFEGLGGVKWLIRKKKIMYSNIPIRNNSRSKMPWRTRNKVRVASPPSRGAVENEAGEFSGGVFQWVYHTLWNAIVHGGGEC